MYVYYYYYSLIRENSNRGKGSGSGSGKGFNQITVQKEKVEVGALLPQSQLPPYYCIVRLQSQPLPLPRYLLPSIYIYVFYIYK